MKKLFLLFCLLQIGVLFLCYPEFYGFYDEDIYLSTTYALQNGSFFYEKAEVPAPFLGIVEADNGTFSQYPPGNSALLLPFTIIHWKLGFLKNILFYIGSFLLFISILRRLDIDPVYSLIFLLHPTLLLFSRTLMSDIPSMFFLLLAVFLIFDKKNIGAGFSLGFLVLLRYPNLIIIAGIFATLLCTKEYKKALLLLPGIFFFSFILLAYIMHTFGFPLGPFSVSGARSFGFQYFIHNFPYYLLSLNVLFPGMLFVAIFSGFKSRKNYFFVIPAFAVIIFYSFYYYIDGGSNVLQKLVKGQRFMVPIIPLLLIPYLNFLHNKKYTRKVFVFIVSLLFVFNCGIQYKHQQLLKRRNHLSKVLREETRGMDILICNRDIDKLLNPYFSKVKFIELSDVKELDLDSLKDNYNVSFVFVELDPDDDYDEKLQWVEYFKSEGFTISYESQDPFPMIILFESKEVQSPMSKVKTKSKPKIGTTDYTLVQSFLPTGQSD